MKQDFADSAAVNKKQQEPESWGTRMCHCLIWAAETCSKAPHELQVAQGGVVGQRRETGHEAIPECSVRTGDVAKMQHACLPCTKLRI